MDLQDKVALVTGAARGIGLATARRLAREGVCVALADLDAAEVSRQAEALRGEGYEALGLQADVADAANVAAMVEATEADLGAIDILVNNAGIGGRTAPLWEVTDEDWERMMAVNLRSVFLCCRAVVPGMLSRGRGRIVNVASIAGKEGNPNAAPYSTAKAGVIALTKALAKEVAGRDVYVNAVSPAVIDTAILEQVSPHQVEYMVGRIPLGRMGKPEEVAALIAWLASDEASFTTGQCVDISGGRATY